MQALVDVIRVECVMKLVGRAANQILRFVSNQLCHPGNRRMEEKQENYNFNQTSPSLSCSAPFCLTKRKLFPPDSHPQRGQRSGSVTAPQQVMSRLTCPCSVWSAGPCCGGWGRWSCPEGTPRWTGEGWAHTAESSLWQQVATKSRRQTDACDLYSGEPGGTEEAH